MFASIFPTYDFSNFAIPRLFFQKSVGFYWCSWLLKLLRYVLKSVDFCQRFAAWRSGGFTGTTFR